MLSARGIEPHRAAHFLIRALFCLFTRVVTNSLAQPATFEPRLRGLFGTLFERSLDPSKRPQLGAHYTGKADILRIVEPVVLAPLRARWHDVREQAEEAVTRRDEVYAKYRGVFDAGATTARKNADTALQSLLTRFLDELGGVKVLVPACSSGNFLYVTLALLMDLQNEVRPWAANNRVGGLFPAVTPQQLYGFEVNAYARELAQVVIWIGYLQWMLAHYGSFEDRPILKPMDTIAERDAVLDQSDPTAPGEPEWPAVYAIIGNPPFIGGKRMRAELGDDYVDTLFSVWDGRVPREADFVCYWYEKARTMLAEGKVQRVGLLATNSIRGGANQKVLQRIKETGDIFMAWSDRPWTLDGAAVRISVVGFDAGFEKTRVLDGKPVASINADLTANVDLTRAKRLTENQSIAFMGDTTGGSFDITAEDAAPMLDAPVNPNGRPNSDVVRPWVNGLDITRRPRGMFIIDFGVDMSLEAAALYELPFAHVERHVKPERAENRRAAYRERWWLHAESRPALRAAVAPLHRYIISPALAKHRVFVWTSPAALPDHALFAFARDDDYTFGVLHSRLHEVWSPRMGTSLEDRPPSPLYADHHLRDLSLPHPTVQQRGAIAEAARDLDAKRTAWLNPPCADDAELRRRTLTNLYNERPAWLRMVHDRLDSAVFAAYGWDSAMSDEELLGRLLTLNLERAGPSGVPLTLLAESVENEA